MRYVIFDKSVSLFSISRQDCVLLGIVKIKIGSNRAKRFVKNSAEHHKVLRKNSLMLIWTEKIYYQSACFVRFSICLIFFYYFFLFVSVVCKNLLNLCIAYPQVYGFLFQMHFWYFIFGLRQLRLNHIYILLVYLHY